MDTQRTHLGSEDTKEGYQVKTEGGSTKGAIGVVNLGNLLVCACGITCDSLVRLTGYHVKCIVFMLTLIIIT